MFQPETEDMLPRTAPKPSAPLTDDSSKIQPTVPEVSILFGQQNPSAAQSAPTPATTTAVGLQQQQQQQQQLQLQLQQIPPPAQAHAHAPTPTYAAWKKQVLPKVTYPPVAGASNMTPTSTEYVVTRSHLYPLRTTMTAAAGPPADSLQYRRSLEPVPPPVYAAPTESTYAVATNSSTVYQQLSNRRSLDTVSTASVRSSCSQYARSATPVDAVLTICASTQTDAPYDPAVKAPPPQPLCDFATKKDVEQLQSTLEEVREMQLRLLQVCEALLLRPQQEECAPSKAAKELHHEMAALAPNGITAANQPLAPTSAPAPSQNAENQFRAAPQFHTPRPTRPQAQSTTYRPNTPLRTQSPQNAVVPQKIGTVLPRPTTDKSVVMNELALKYLPNEKLNELLNELNISPRAQPQQRGQGDAPSTPLHNKENVEKRPSDISNASYKYLKKYRLLPEGATDDYQQQQGELIKSPRLGRHPQSPHQCAAAPMPGMPQQMLDLEHIRLQPKFL